jgi:hypothetical protein
VRMVGRSRSQTVALAHDGVVGVTRQVVDNRCPSPATGYAVAAVDEVDELGEPIRRSERSDGCGAGALAHLGRFAVRAERHVDHTSAASAVYVLADTECFRSSSQTGSGVRTVARPTSGSTPPASAAHSRANQAWAARFVSKVRPAT